MGKYRRYKNILEMFLSSEKGKRALNFCYSWGASIVIIGALFKLLHLPYANQILFIAMITEACVFFISAFERPNDEYHWEDVFPVLKSKNPLDRPAFSNGQDNATQENGNNGMPFINMGGMQSNLGANAAASLGLNVTEEDTKNLSESIKKLSGAANQISKMAELTEATQHYLEQLSSMSKKMEKFSEVTGSLTEVSDTLLNSYKGIADNPSSVSQNATSYVEQMDALNRNIAGLNSVYEMQLKSISAQMENIERINAGLNRIREMYEGSVIDRKDDPAVIPTEPSLQPSAPSHDCKYVYATAASREQLPGSAESVCTTASLPGTVWLSTTSIQHAETGLNQQT